MSGEAQNALVQVLISRVSPTSRSQISPMAQIAIVHRLQIQ